MRTTRSRPILLSVIGAVIGALLMAVLSLSSPSGPVEASSGDAQYFVDQINALRASVGLGPLGVDGNMAGLASNHTAAMIGSGQLVHAPDLATGVSGPWTRLGENIGRGGNPSVVWNTFVNSPGHYANLTNPVFTHVGIGVAYDAGGQLWTTHRFVARPGGGGGGAVVAPPPPPPERIWAPPAPAPSLPQVNPQVSVPAPPPEPAPPPPPPPLSNADPARAGAVLDVLRASPD